MKEILNRYLFSYDTGVSAILTIGVFFLFPDIISGGLVNDLLGMGIGVLSIIFSIFFAALAFIIGASDDEFVAFLEEVGVFSKIIQTFKWTVTSLFVALIYSIIVYIIVAFNLSENKNYEVGEIVMIVFSFLFFYSLIATMLSTNDAIKYAQRRNTFVQKKKALKNEQQEEAKKASNG